MKVSLKQLITLSACTLIFPATFAKHRAQIQTLVYPPHSAVMAAIKDPNSNAVYIAGKFTEISRNIGSMALFNTTGDLLPNLARVNGTINVSAPDGSGGFYIAGEFSIKSETMITRNFAHILADGSVDTSFSPGTNVGNIKYMSRVDNKLYVANISDVALIDLTTGKSDPNFAVKVTDSPVLKINTIHATRNGLYIGGFFRHINGHAIKYFAKADLETGSIDTNYYRSDRIIGKIISTNNNSLFLEDITTYHTLSKVNESTGRKDLGFKLSTLSPSARIRALAADNSWLYIGAGLGLNSGKTKRFDLITGTEDKTFKINTPAWVKNIFFDNKYMYVSSVYDFSSKTGYANVKVARFNKDDMSRDFTFEPQSSGLLNTASIENGHLLIGGNLKGAGKPVSPGYVAKINPDTGLPDFNFFPHVNGPVRTLAIYNDSLFIGGDFTKINNIRAYKLAKLSKTTGDVDLSFMPSPNNSVNTIKIHDNYLYVGGRFSNISKSNRSKFVARYSLPSLIYDKTYNLQINGSVHSIAFDDSSIYVGGYVKGRLSKYNLATRVKDLDFMPTLNGAVNGMTIVGDSIYVGGYFRRHFLKLNKFTGLTDPLFDLNLGRCTTVEKYKNFIYAGGVNYLIRFDSATGLIDDTFAANPDRVVYNVKPYDGGLLVSGTFQTIFNIRSPYFINYESVNTLKRNAVTMPA
ncbi:MAG: hypothetical protein P1U40_04890 [Coxiellaceae bacterium]|nr:hypothetical protein [Coxiellaceae bacterium]